MAGSGALVRHEATGFSPVAPVRYRRVRDRQASEASSSASLRPASIRRSTLAPTRESHSSRSDFDSVVIAATLITASVGSRDSDMCNWTLPGASTNRRSDEIASAMTVGIWLRLKASPGDDQHRPQGVGAPRVVDARPPDVAAADHQLSRTAMTRRLGGCLVARRLCRVHEIQSRGDVSVVLGREKQFERGGVQLRARHLAMPRELVGRLVERVGDRHGELHRVPSITQYAATASRSSARSWGSVGIGPYPGALV